MTHTPVLDRETKPAGRVRWPRAVLIASPETYDQARAMLCAAPGSPELLGSVLIGDGTADDVLGGVEDLAAIRSSLGASLAIVCLPASMGEMIGLVRTALRDAGMEERFMPPLEDLLAQAPPLAIGVGLTGGEVFAPSPRIDLSSLIGRPQRTIDRQSIGRVLSGRRVLITGAGGSIGGELARIAASFDPSQLILVERAENALFEIDRSLARRHPHVARAAILHDVVDADATRRMFERVRPDVVFHAAAHKHVPLMEDHPARAVENNVFGTRSVADAATAAGCDRFVMISSDKAVHPKSVMGATKRLAELYVHHAQAHSDTRFSIVRFGNVLGSACSVLTIWSAQIAEGGPITVTDPRMTRYFMTIPEAAALVMQSAAIGYAKGAGHLAPGTRTEDRSTRAHSHSEVAMAPGVQPLRRSVASSLRRFCAGLYVLDMGEPIRIVDLAERFVHTHGMRGEWRVASGELAAESRHSSLITRHCPERDLPTIPIVFTGIRPGEKLEEELAYSAESLVPTPFDGINAWTGGVDAEVDVPDMLEELGRAVHDEDRGRVVAAIRRYVPVEAGA